ncbi:MAG: hypothetical protein MUF87_18410 [Anaerolineae bacterium]|jgi:hypothetical protein|nr:hypothetical protein [Anaerolineae bacterium]
MSLSPSTQNELQTLREAAHAREWTTLQNSLTRLLTVLGVFESLEVLVSWFQRHLPTFQHYHPDEAEPSGKVVRDLLLMIVSFGYAPDKLPDFLTNDYPTPGSGQFVHAILEACRAVQKDRQASERYGYLVSAFANAILAELTATWYSQHLDDFERVRNNHVDPLTGEYTDPDAARIPLKFWIDPEIATRDTAAWLALADQLEQQILKTQA